jgi:hypothetical protein
MGSFLSVFTKPKELDSQVSDEVPLKPMSTDREPAPAHQWVSNLSLLSACQC